MRHALYRVESFERVNTYDLRIQFDDGLCREIDFEPILEGELYGPLRDPAEFARVSLYVGVALWSGL